VKQKPDRQLARRLGNAIREARAQHYPKMTIEQVAESAELSADFLSKVERGQHGLSVQNLLRIADAIGVDPELLLGGLREQRDVRRSRLVSQLSTYVAQFTSEEIAFATAVVKVAIEGYPRRSGPRQ
jgi:transcriptional regulator with XRE-family HTH domain